MWTLLHLPTATYMYSQGNRRAVEKWFDEHDFLQNKFNGEVVSVTRFFESSNRSLVRFDVTLPLVRIDPSQWIILQRCEFEIV